MIARLANKIKIIYIVSTELGITKHYRLKLFIIGIWLLIIDKWKQHYIFWARLQYKNNLFSFNFVDLGDYFLFHEIFFGSHYKIDLEDESPVIFDIGANIGVSAIYFKILYPDSRVYCFEPDPKNFRRLKRNLSQFKDVYLYEVAIWSESGSAKFYQDKHRGSSSSMLESNKKRNCINVKTLHLDDVMRSTGVELVDLVKVDVEGSEIEILKGLNKSKIIKYFVGEIHGDIVDFKRVRILLSDRFKSVNIISSEKGNRYYVKATTFT